MRKRIELLGVLILCIVLCIFILYCSTLPAEHKKENNFILEIICSPIPTPSPTPVIIEATKKTKTITCPNDDLMCGIIKSIIEKRSAAPTPEPTPANPYVEMIDNLTEYETEILCRIVVKECIDEPLDGQRAVIEVIFNRVLSKMYPNTIEKVLSEKGQFATWNYRQYAKDKDIETIKEVLQIVHDSDYVILPNLDYIYFSTKKQKYAKNYVTIQGHNFGTDLASDYVLTAEDEEEFYNRLTK